MFDVTECGKIETQSRVLGARKIQFLIYKMGWGGGDPRGPLTE